MTISLLNKGQKKCLNNYLKIWKHPQDITSKQNTEGHVHPWESFAVLIPLSSLYIFSFLAENFGISLISTLLLHEQWLNCWNFHHIVIFNFWLFSNSPFSLLKTLINFLDLLREYCHYTLPFCIAIAMINCYPAFIFTGFHICLLSSRGQIL